MALITGSASGQGRAAALRFARHGAAIAIVDIADDGSAETARQVEALGGEATVIHADVSVQADVEAMVAATVERWGRLDVLYNNAAVQMSGRLVECSEDGLGPNDRHQPRRRLLGLPGRAARDAGGRGRLDHQHRFGPRSHRLRGLRGLRRGQGRSGRPDPTDRRRVRAVRAGQRHRPRIHRHAPLPEGGGGDGRPRGLRRRAGQDHPAAPAGHGRGRGLHRPLPGQSTCRPTSPARSSRPTAGWRCTGEPRRRRGRRGVRPGRGHQREAVRRRVLRGGGRHGRRRRGAGGGPHQRGGRRGRRPRRRRGGGDGRPGRRLRSAEGPRPLRGRRDPGPAPGDHRRGVAGGHRHQPQGPVPLPAPRRAPDGRGRRRLGHRPRARPSG